jgi:hypothetical protein
MVASGAGSWNTDDVTEAGVGQTVLNVGMWA